MANQGSGRTRMSGWIERSAAMAFLFTLAAATLSPAQAQAQLAYGPDTCRQGYVWREAFPDDHVCVSPDTRSQAADDNSQAAARREPNGGDYGPDTCLQGYVWREAGGTDHVCVTPDIREQAAYDNSQAEARRERSLAAPQAAGSASEYKWSQGNPPVQMMNVQDGLCTLRAVTGKFEGRGEQMLIYQDGGYWYLGGSSDQKAVGGGARCYPFSVFRNASVDGVYTYAAEASKPGDNVPLPRHSFCFLMGISGKLRGSGEFVTVIQDTNHDFYASAFTNQRSIRGDFGCVDLYDGAGTFISDPAMSLDARLAPFYQAPASEGYVQFNLPGADESLCVLTRVGGKFRGGGEVINLFTSDEAQALAITSNQKGVHAGVACYYYDQANR